ncbi:MAG TPA: type II CAAX endopeptidase family protein [Anaerolineales bacterium]|nr:type II CAAX endopeptidase family protein [Anaerolineales bacterium]
MKDWIQKHQLLSFFVLTYAIMFGAVFTSIHLRPGQPDHPWSLTWFLYAFSPTYSALIVSWIIGGTVEVKRLLSGFLRWKVGLRWYLAAAYLFLGPLTFALIYSALGNPIPGINPGLTMAAILGQLVFTLFSGPIAEETGWRGFALPRLQSRYNALVSSLILGVIWCCWHIPLFFLPGSSQQGIPFPIYLMLVVTLGIYFTWLYNNTHGSLIITVLAHFSFNLSGGFLAGTLGLLPPMVLYVAAGSLLVLTVLGVVIYFGAVSLSRKPVGELPI